uniref:Uncharacterized protein n=1 Tax=Eutreptiella gymnastica TaxID=73025 RepID=A0A7S1N3F3_9EUGL|mmetsp:Transcript_113101/g.196395  ORF Transcript_113101/g.196395 Transcript_113101/m.196395 type:complete len:833 (+) Transcript_113101:65-2563(+)
MPHPGDGPGGAGDIPDFFSAVQALKERGSIRFGPKKVQIEEAEWESEESEFIHKDASRLTYLQDPHAWGHGSKEFDPMEEVKEKARNHFLKYISNGLRLLRYPMPQTWDIFAAVQIMRHFLHGLAFTGPSMLKRVRWYLRQVRMVQRHWHLFQFIKWLKFAAILHFWKREEANRKDRLRRQIAEYKSDNPMKTLSNAGNGSPLMEYNTAIPDSIKRRVVEYLWDYRRKAFFRKMKMFLATTEGKKTVGKAANIFLNAFRKKERAPRSPEMSPSSSEKDPHSPVKNLSSPVVLRFDMFEFTEEDLRKTADLVVLQDFQGKLENLRQERLTVRRKSLGAAIIKVTTDPCTDRGPSPVPEAQAATRIYLKGPHLDKRRLPDEESRATTPMKRTKQPTPTSPKASSTRRHSLTLHHSANGIRRHFGPPRDPRPWSRFTNNAEPPEWLPPQILPADHSSSYESSSPNATASRSSPRSSVSPSREAQTPQARDPTPLLPVISGTRVLTTPDPAPTPWDGDSGAFKASAAMNRSQSTPLYTLKSKLPSNLLRSPTPDKVDRNADPVEDSVKVRMKELRASLETEPKMPIANGSSVPEQITMLDVHELEQWAGLYLQQQQQQQQPTSASPMTYMEHKSRQYKDLLQRFPSLNVGSVASGSSTASTPSHFAGAVDCLNRPTQGDGPSMMFASSRIRTPQERWPQAIKVAKVSMSQMGLPVDGRGLRRMSLSALPARLSTPPSIAARAAQIRRGSVKFGRSLDGPAPLIVTSPRGGTRIPATESPNGPKGPKGGLLPAGQGFGVGPPLSAACPNTSTNTAIIAQSESRVNGEQPQILCDRTT